MIAAMDWIRRWFDSRWLMAAIVALLVVLVSTHIPQELMREPLQVRLLDKVEHIAAYGAVALLFLLSFRRPPGVKTMLIVLAVGAAVGGLDEKTQPWVNRIASWSDLAADVIGIALACLLFVAMQSFRRERPGRSASVPNS